MRNLLPRLESGNIEPAAALSREKYYRLLLEAGDVAAVALLFRVSARVTAHRFAPIERVLLAGDSEICDRVRRRLEEDEQVEGWYRRRLDLTPGMTGRWQVLGCVRVPLQEMVQLDYLYVANWSLWGDVKIMLRTLPFVPARRGL